MLKKHLLKNIFKNIVKFGKCRNALDMYALKNYSNSTYLSWN